MTEQEFLDKMENEGIAYAFTEYGLSENDLDENVRPEFRTAVKDARIAYQRAEEFVRRIYELSD